MFKFKVGDRVIFNHNNTTHKRDNKIHIIINIDHSCSYPYEIKMYNDDNSYVAYESELTLVTQKRNHLPKWW